MTTRDRFTVCIDAIDILLRLLPLLDQDELHPVLSYFEATVDFILLNLPPEAASE